MRFYRLYHEQALHENDAISLSAAQSHYLYRVLRARVGQTIELFCGDGASYPSTVTTVGPVCRLLVGTPDLKQQTHPPYIELAQGLCKQSAMDMIIQKAVELGVTTITPLFTDYSDTKRSRFNTEKKMAHWRRIIISACEQCGRNTLPTLNPPLTFAHWITHPNTHTKLLCHPHATTPLTAITPKADIVLSIGPEGGFSEAEYTAAQAAGFTDVKLFDYILRAETAVISSLSILQTLT